MQCNLRAYASLLDALASPMQSQSAEELHLRRAALDAQQCDLENQVTFNRA